MDEIIRAVSKDGFVKISVVTARDAVQRANAIHHCSPTAIAALGRSLCAASMLGDLLKEENGNQSRTAQRLGISRTTLWRLLHSK